MNSLFLQQRAWPLLAAAACLVPVAATAQPVTPHDFEASGPLRVAADQVVRVCATNYSGTAHDMLLAIVDATPGSNAPGNVLISQPTQLAPRATACVALPGLLVQQRLGPHASVIGFAVDGGFVSAGVIQQGIGVGGGGCIASLQLIDVQARRTTVMTPLQRYRVPQGTGP